jgi:diguanylate cyclase (GGDEF)-like protein/PAS domain S-box-containing protein
MGRIQLRTALLIASTPTVARSIAAMFRHQGLYSFALEQAACLDDAESFLAQQDVDVVLIDLDSPSSTEQEAVQRVRKIAPRVSIVLLVNQKDEATARKSIEEGAQDYLLKGLFGTRDLMRALRNAVERKILDETLFAEKERAQVTLDCIGDAVICTDFTGNITFLNPVAERMTGWSLLEATGQPLADAFHIMDATTRIRTQDPMAKAVAQNRIGALPVNCILVRRDGHEVFIEDSVAPIHDREGTVAGSVLVFRDISVAHALAEQIAHLAECDALTGLPNRLLLNDRITQAIALASRHAGKVAVLYLDLDGFKHINDSLGHLTGDRLLQSIAQRLQGCVRAPDTVSRQGGDEFVLLLQEVQHPTDAVSAAKRALQAVAEVHSIDHHELHISASMGVSIYPEDGLNAETLLQNADTAMYHAKGNGKHSFAFFQPAMNVLAVERQSIEEDLRSALERQEFTLHYQPKIDLKTGAITGAEALIRWTHPTRGSVPPLKFIPIAEDSGLILPIGAWVLGEACAQARAWIDAGLPLSSIAVNVSACQFHDKGFLDNLFATLRKTGLSPNALELEITESVLMKHAEIAATILQTLREKGVQVSIDDFGTGYSSLSYLRKFPLDSLKIDQSFVHHIGETADQKTIVSAIISMGRCLNLRVIAEGVETAGDLEFLKAHDCDEAQGFFFSRAVPPEEFFSLLSADATAMPCN